MEVKKAARAAPAHTPRQAPAAAAMRVLGCSALTLPHSPHFITRSRRPREVQECIQGHTARGWQGGGMKPRARSWAPPAPGPTEASAQAPSRGRLPAFGGWSGLLAQSVRPAL